jgi:hypothetical protein
LAVGLGACGRGKSASDAGGAADSGDAADAAGDCFGDMTVTLTGAFSATRAVPIVLLSYSSSNDTSTVYESAEFGMPFFLLMSFTFPGMPSVATYSEATAGETCLILLADSADQTRTWLSAAGPINQPNQGTCSITFTSVTPTPSSPSQIPYCVHGSLRATLPAAAGGTSTGTVTLTSSF